VEERTLSPATLAASSSKLAAVSLGLHATGRDAERGTYIEETE
jgi:hypothetical protein